MIQQLLHVLGSLADDNQRKNAQATADQQAGQDLYKEAKSRADVGDWQWMLDNQQGLQQHLHPTTLNSLITTTRLQNGRIFDEQTAAGERPTIPLSPWNIAQRGAQQTYDLRGGTGSMSPEMAAISAVGGSEPERQPYNGEVGATPMPSMVQSDQPVVQTTPPPMINAEAMLQEGRGNITPGDMSQFAPSEQPAPAALPMGSPAAANPTLQVPPNRQPVNKSRSLQTATGTETRTTNIPGTTGKEVMASLISQGEAQRMHPQAIIQKFNEENVRRLKAGEPALDMDEQAINGYRSRAWETSRTDIQRNLTQQGMDPQQAFLQSVQMAFNQNGYAPEQYMQYLPKLEPGMQAAGAFHAAIQQGNSQLETTMQGLQAPLKGLRPRDMINSVFSQPFLLKAVQGVPGMNPADSTRALHELASTAHSAFLTAIQQTHPELTPQQQNYFAVSMASKAVGGNVPEQWRAFVEQDPKVLGVGPEDMQVYQGMRPQDRPDVLDPDFGNRIKAARTAIEMNKEVRQATLNKLNTPEAVSAFANPKSAAGQTPGQIDRSIDLAKKGEEKQQTETIQRKNAILPETLRTKLQGRDELYQRGIKAQQLANLREKDPKTGQPIAGTSILEKYGDQPGTFFNFMNRAKGELGKQDKVLNAYLNTIAGFYNLERHELSGTAVSATEAKPLAPYLPAPDDNVRTGIMKLNALVHQIGGFMDKDITQLKKDYPASDYESYFYSQAKKRRDEQKAAK